MIHSVSWVQANEVKTKKTSAVCKMVRNVRWGLFMESFVDKEQNFEHDPLLYGKPVESNQYRCDRVVFPAIDNDASIGALDILESGE